MPASALPAATELAAPDAWQRIEFISDLHLHESDPATFQAWSRYLDTTTADAVFILGDLFEAWPGDDACEVPGFAHACAAVLAAATRVRPVFFMHGNRDFLVGERLSAATGLQLLADPTVLAFAGQRWLLSHGDALCLDDTEYLAFRSTVREAGWQRDFLSRPLAERQQVAATLREQSEARKRSGVPYADIDAPAAVGALRAAGAAVLVHGHTHRPGDHALGDPYARVVLSDWDAAASPPRIEVLSVDRGGRWTRLRPP